MGRSWCSRFLIVILFLFSFSGFAQDLKNEADVKKKAEVLFTEQDYVSAFPLFSQLLSLYPKDPNYNYKFGVCLLFTSDNKEKPLTYLQFAAKKPETEKEVFFFLGKAYHLNYRFSDAINAYERFKKEGNPKTFKKYDVDQHITMCKSGVSLLKNVRDLYVLDKKAMREEDFFRAYNADGALGRLIVKPDEFKTAVDKKKKETSVLFLSPNSKELFVSSYGQDEKNGKDIYRIKKLPSGEWGNPENIGSVINTPFDEDYPFMHPDGKTLYFSSKGHNSMGGYDVFKSTYNAASNTWSQPVNLDYAVSTPDDDILYMPDTSYSFAYFASRRSSAAGNLDVYKLRIDKEPAQIALIKGTLASEVGSGYKSAKITVKKAESGEVVGEFNTNEKTGEYLINVPSGGKFMFQVESDVFAARSEQVSIPTQYELRTLRQTITLKPERLLINNYFDEAADSASYMAAIDFLKKKANLEVNYKDVKTSSEEIKSGEPIAKETPVNTNTTNPNSKPTPNPKTENAAKFSNDELVKIANEDAAETRKEAEDLQDKSDAASFASNTKAEEAKQKLAEATTAENAAASSTDPVKKEEELHKAESLKKEADLLTKEAAAIGTLAQNLYKESQEKFKEAKQNETYAKELDAAVRSNSKESILKLTEQRSQLETTAVEKENDFGLAQLKEETEAKQEQATKAEKRLEELKQELTEAESEQNSIKAQADKTKNKKEKQALVQQADNLTPDIEEKRKQVQEQTEKSELARTEANVASNQLETFTKVLSGVSGTEIASSGSSANTSKTSSSVAANESTDPVKLISQVSQEHESQLSAAFSKPDGPEKQKALAQVYDKWGTSLQAEADKRKAELKKITDPKKKSDAADVIMALESASAEKLALASDALSNADNLSAAKQPENSNPAINNSQVTEPVITENAGNKETSVPAPVVKAQTEREQFTATYSNAFANAEKIEDEAQREKGKTEVLDKWVATLKGQSAELRSQIDAASDPEVKSALQTELKIVESSLTEKQNQASLSFAKAERLMKEKNNAVQPTTTPSGENAAYSIAYQDKLKQAEAIQDQQKREAEKAAIYAAWVEDIKKEKSEKESQLNATSDPAAKQAITETITKLDQFEKEQSSLAVKAKQNSEIPVATVAKSPEVTESVISGVNTSYETKLASTDTIKDPAIKQQQKVAVLEDWSKQLTTLAENARSSANSINDDELKKVELGKADQLEAQAKQKQQEATQLNQSALVSNTSEPVKTQTIPENQASALELSPVVSLEKPAPVETEKFEQSLKTADASTDELSKAQSKTKIYDQWAKDIDKQITYLKEKKAVTKDQAEISAIDSEIAVLEKQSLEKKTLASMQVSKADRLKKEQEAAIANTAEVSKEQTPVTTTSLNTSVPEAVTNNSSEQAPVPAKEILARLNESARLQHESDSIRANLSSLPDVSQRTAALAKSSELEKRSIELRVSASESMAAESQVTYNSNQAKLNEFATVSARNQSDEVTMANMLQTESEYFNKEAKSIRAAVKESEPSSAKINSLERAEEYEKLSVEKQQKALTLYAKANSGYELKGIATQPQPSNETVPTTQPQVTKTETTPVTSEPPVVKNEQPVNNTSTTAVVNPTDTVIPTAAIQTDTAKVTASTKKFATKSDSLNAIRVTTEADRLENVGLAEEKVADDFRYKASRERTAADSLKLEAVKPERSADQGSLMTEAVTKEKLATVYTQRADSVLSLAANSKAAAKAKREEAALLAMSEPVKKQEPVKTTPSEPVATQPKAGNEITAGNSANTANTTDVSIPADYLTETNELKREIFIAFANKSAYSSNKPIPINEKLPNGVIFKVQVGAFRNPIPPEALKGFAPLMGETTQNGITRYTAGLFKSLESANIARKEIQSVGYRDAFVVAFCNGQRISVNEAQALIKTGGSCPTGPAIVSNQNAINPVESQPQPLNPEPGKTPENTEPANQQANTSVKLPALTTNSVAENTSVEEVKGLFYTVQVGVFANKVPASKLKYLQPLFGEPTDKGQVRYSVGMYNNLDLAKKARQIAIQAGIADAFITAYVNGKRISVSEGQKTEAEKGNSVFATHEMMNRLPESGLKETSTPTATFTDNRNAAKEVRKEIEKQPEVNADPVSSPVVMRTNTVFIPMSDTGLVFRVQIGAFKDEVPIDIAAKFLKIADKGINHYQGQDSLTIYIVGGARDYETANRLKEEVIASGLTDSFVVAYRRGEKVAIEGAIKETNVKY